MLIGACLLFSAALCGAWFIAALAGDTGQTPKYFLGILVGGGLLYAAKLADEQKDQKD